MYCIYTRLSGLSPDVWWWRSRFGRWKLHGLFIKLVLLQSRQYLKGVEQIFQVSNNQTILPIKLWFDPNSSIVWRSYQPRYVSWPSKPPTRTIIQSDSIQMKSIEEARQKDVKGTILESCFLLSEDVHWMYFSHIQNANHIIYIPNTCTIPCSSSILCSCMIMFHYGDAAETMSWQATLLSMNCHCSELVVKIVHVSDSEAWQLDVVHGYVHHTSPAGFEFSEGLHIAWTMIKHGSGNKAWSCNTIQMHKPIGLIHAPGRQLAVD